MPADPADPADPAVAAGEYGDAEGRQIEADPAGLRMKADGRDAFIAGIADEHQNGDAQRIREKHEHRPDRHHQERLREIKFAPEEP